MGYVLREVKNGNFCLIGYKIDKKSDFIDYENHIEEKIDDLFCFIVDDESHNDKSHNDKSYNDVPMMSIQQFQNSEHKYNRSVEFKIVNVKNINAYNCQIENELYKKRTIQDLAACDDINYVKPADRITIKNLLYVKNCEQSYTMYCILKESKIVFKFANTADMEYFLQFQWSELQKQ